MRKATLYLAGVLLLPVVVNSDNRPRLLKIEETKRRSHARRILGRAEYNSLARDVREYIAVEKFILSKIESALPLYSKLQTHAIANAIIEEANRFHFDPLLILAMIEQESKIQPHMRGSHGEIGLMQIRPKTAKWIAKKYNLAYSTKKQLLNPVFNIQIGVRYLSYLDQKFDFAQQSIAAYNMGPNNVRKILKKKKQPEVYFRPVSRRYRQFYAESKVYSRSDLKPLIARQ